MNSKKDVFPWEIKNETLEQRYIRLKKTCCDITLQEVCKMDRQLREETDSIAYKLTEVPKVKINDIT
jgi:hypothetical protein